MMFLKKAITLLCFTFCIGISPLFAAELSVKTCSDYPLFQLDENGNKQWNGQNVETLHYLAEHLNWQIEDSVRATFGRCLKLLASGDVDILIGLVSTPDRGAKFLMVPYSRREQLAIFHAANEDGSIALDNLPAEFLIGIHQGFELPQSIKDSQLSARLTYIASVNNGFEMLMKHRLHGVLSTVRTGLTVIDECPEFANKFDFTPLSDREESLIYFGVSKLSPLAQQQSKLKEAIRWLSEQAQYQHLELINPNPG